MIGMLGLKNVGSYFDQDDIISAADTISSLIQKQLMEIPHSKQLYLGGIG